MQANRQKKTAKSAISIVIDRWHAGLIGPYGNAWISTPALDALAADSVVFDRHFATSLKLAAIAESHWGPNGQMLESLAGLGVRTMLFTDSEEIAQLPATENFKDRYLVTAPVNAQIADEPEETHLFRFFAEMVELAEQASEQPYFLWCFFESLGKLWDFPHAYRNRYHEEGDPEPYAGLAVPYLDTTSSPDFSIHPDDYQAVLETYAGGVTLLDDALSGVLDYLAGGELGSETLLALTAARGFSLGEHGILGIPPAETLDPEPLWEETTHLPLLIRFPDKSAQTVRCSALTEPADLRHAMEQWFGNPMPTSLLDLATETCDALREELVIETDSASALVTPNWLLRCPRRDKNSTTIHSCELYVKPDDRWEVNDVASRCAEIVQELLDQWRNGTKKLQDAFHHFDK